MSDDLAKEDPAQPLGVWHLDVVSGPNAGASVPLRDGRYRLGSCIDNDIILADPAMADHQAILSVGGGGATLEPAAPGIQSRGKRLHAGEALNVAGGCELAVGDTFMKFTPPPRRARRRWPVALAGAVPLVLMTSLAFGLTHSHVKHKPALVVHTAAVAAPARLAPTPADAQTALQIHLAGAGLSPAVALSQTNGAVVATGALQAAQLPAWTAAHMWFDGRYHGSIALVDQVAKGQPPAGPSFAIRAVSSGDVPYVIDTRGERYTVGAVVDGGWTIQYIGNDRVTLRKDGREVSETL